MVGNPLICCNPGVPFGRVISKEEIYPAVQLVITRYQRGAGRTCKPVVDPGRPQVFVIVTQDLKNNPGISKEDRSPVRYDLEPDSVIALSFVSDEL